MPGQNRRSSTSADALALASDRARAIALRSSGATLDQVAQMVTLPNGERRWKSKQAVHYAIRQAIRNELKPELDEMIHLQESRLDQALMAIWTRVKRGELAAVDQMLRIETRRAKLFGLDAPKRMIFEGHPVEQDTQIRMAELFRRVLAEVPDPEARKRIAAALIIDEPRALASTNER
jgi:hypothetical protein